MENANSVQLKIVQLASLKIFVKLAELGILKKTMAKYVQDAFQHVESALKMI